MVTPTLNQASYLEQTLRSVRAQGYEPLQHIVMDGGSTDGTLDILRREQDAGRLELVTEPDRGMYDAINKGLARARGEILAYLNSDDAWFPWTLETVTAAFAARPDAEIIFGDGIKVEEGTGTQRLRLFGPFDRLSLANFESICQPAVFWRRRLYERMGGFDSSMRFVADLDYWLRAAERGAVIAHVSEVLAIERIHEERLSSSQEGPMAAEAQAMRAVHAGSRGGPEGRIRARERDKCWQRWLWLRFMVAFAIRPLDRSWRRFIRDGGVTVRGRQALRAIRHYKYHGLYDAVTSSLAAEILGSDRNPPVPPPGLAARLVKRAKLLALAVPFMPMARLDVTGVQLRRLARS